MTNLLSTKEVSEDEILASLIEVAKILKDVEKKKESSDEKENETNLNKQAKSILMELVEVNNLNLIVPKDLATFRTMTNYLDACDIEPFMKDKDFASAQKVSDEINEIKDEFLVTVVRQLLDNKKPKYKEIVSKYTENSIDTFVKENNLNLITNKGIKTLNEWFNEQPKIYPDLESNLLEEYIEESQKQGLLKLDKLLNALFTEKIVAAIKKDNVNFGDELESQITTRLLANDIPDNIIYAVQLRLGLKISEIGEDKKLWQNLEKKYTQKALSNPKFMDELTTDYIIKENKDLSDSKEKIEEMILNIKKEVDRLSRLEEKAWTRIKKENLSFAESWYLINYRDLRERIWADLNINDQDYKIIISYIRNKMAEKVPEKCFATILYNRYKAMINDLDSDSYEKMYNEIMPRKFFENAPECPYLSEEKILEVVERVLNHLRKTIVKNLCDKNLALKQYWHETENLINHILFENKDYKDILKIQNEKIKNLNLSSFESKILVEYMNAYLKTCYKKRMEEAKKKKCTREKILQADKVELIDLLNHLDEMIFEKTYLQSEAIEDICWQIAEKIDIEIENVSVNRLRNDIESFVELFCVEHYISDCYLHTITDYLVKRVRQLKTAANYLNKKASVLEGGFIYQDKDDMIFYKNKILLDSAQSAMVTGAILCLKGEKSGIIIYSKEELEKLILSGDYQFIGYEVEMIQDNQIKKLYVEQENLELKKEKQKNIAKRSNNKILYDKKSLRKRKRASKKANRIKKFNRLKNKWESYLHKDSYINGVKPKRRKKKQFAFRSLFFITGMFILLKSVVGIEWKEIFHFKGAKQTFEDPNEMQMESLEDAIKNEISSDIEFLEIPNEYVSYAPASSVELQENESDNYKISQKESIKGESLKRVSIEDEKVVEETKNHILNLERALPKRIQGEQEIEVLLPDMDAKFTISEDARLLTSMDDINVKEGFIPSLSEEEERKNGGIVLESPEGIRITTINFEEAVSLVEYQGYHYIGLRATNNYSNEQAQFEGFYASDDIILEDTGKSRHLKP